MKAVVTQGCGLHPHPSLPLRACNREDQVAAAGTENDFFLGKPKSEKEEKKEMKKKKKSASRRVWASRNAVA
jgi:hypothetical protein